MRIILFIAFLSAVSFNNQISAQNNNAISIVQPGAGEQLDLGTGKVIIKIPGNLTKGAFSQVELLEHPGYETPLHVHSYTDELFYVLEGTLTLLIDGIRKTAEAGSYIFIPKGIPHAQGNFSDLPVRLLITFYPAGFEEFFRERAEIVSEHPPGSSEYGLLMRELGQKYDIQNIEFSPFDESEP